jgi:hypothetical protein
LCSIFCTLGFKEHAFVLERLLVRNLEMFYSAAPARAPKDEEYFSLVLFLGSLATRRSTTLGQVLKFMQSKSMIADLQAHCYSRDADVESLMCTPAAVSQSAGQSQRKLVQTVSRQVLDLLLAAVQSDATLSLTNTPTLVPAATLVPAVTAVPAPAASRPRRLLALVDVFVAWLDYIAKNVALPHVEVECLVFFDAMCCKIECVTTDNTVYRRFKITREGDQRSATMSLMDCNEWLRYMVLLQIDERNVHRETKFLLYASPSSIEFGPPPNISFELDGIDFLTYFLLKSAFTRATLYQTRPALREMRRQMSVALAPFVQIRGAREYIVLSEALFETVGIRFQLPVVQGVSMAPYF